MWWSIQQLYFTNNQKREEIIEGRTGERKEWGNGGKKKVKRKEENTEGQKKERKEGRWRKRGREEGTERYISI